MTASRRSAAIRRSSTKRGSGVISAITIASTASGTTISPREESGKACDHFQGAGETVFDGVIDSARQLSVHQLENVGQNFGHGAVEMRRDILADIDGFV